MNSYWVPHFCGKRLDLFALISITGFGILNKYVVVSVMMGDIPIPLDIMITGGT